MVSELTLRLFSCLFQSGPNTECGSGESDLGCYVVMVTYLVSDELLLPHMKRVDGMITDNRKRLLHKLHIGQVLKVGESFKLHIVSSVCFSSERSCKYVFEIK